MSPQAAKFCAGMSFARFWFIILSNPIVMIVFDVDCFSSQWSCPTEFLIRQWAAPKVDLLL